MAHERPRIVLIEESELLAEITAFRLELLGYEVRSLDPAADLIPCVIEAAVDLIVLNASLSDADGIEIANRLGNDDQTSQIPVLLFSADSDLDTVERAFHAGVDDYLVTPFDPAVLQEKIENLLSGRVEA